MKTYTIREVGLHSKSSIMKMGETAYNNWVTDNATRNYGLYRIVGDPNSNHFYVDFELMYEVNVEEN